jgi:hypothetical protein
MLLLYFYPCCDHRERGDGAWTTCVNGQLRCLCSIACHKFCPNPFCDLIETGVAADELVKSTEATPADSPEPASTPLSATGTSAIDQLTKIIMSMLEPIFPDEMMALAWANALAVVVTVAGVVLLLLVGKADEVTAKIALMKPFHPAPPVSCLPCETMCTQARKCNVQCPCSTCTMWIHHLQVSYAASIPDSSIALCCCVAQWKLGKPRYSMLCKGDLCPMARSRRWSLQRLCVNCRSVHRPFHCLMTPDTP